MTNWGIVGTGLIAGWFISGLRETKGANIKAVCSRSEAKAKAYAKENDIELCFSSYEQMAKCKDIDVIYIGTPHTCHKEHVKLFLENGKPVLCEKPLGVNAREVKEMVKTAKKAGVFFMEGMWTRFFPSTLKAIEWVKTGEIGDVRFLNASFGLNGDGLGWRWDNAMAGGSVLDVGIYPLAVTLAMLGFDYIEIIGTANVLNGIDHLGTATLKYGNGAIANLSFSLNQIMDNTVSVEGTKGRVFLGKKLWWQGKCCELQKTGDGGYSHEGEVEHFEIPYESTGFQYEAEHVQDCINKGLLESPLMTLDESINLAQTMDKLRKIYGVEYKQDLLY